MTTSSSGITGELSSTDDCARENPCVSRDTQTEGAGGQQDRKQHAMLMSRSLRRFEYSGGQEQNVTAFGDDPSHGILSCNVCDDCALQ